jgi:hypothetical protein
MLRAAYLTFKHMFRCIILTQVWVDRRFFHGETLERQMERTVTYIDRGDIRILLLGHISIFASTKTFSRLNYISVAGIAQSV